MHRRAARLAVLLVAASLAACGTTDSRRDSPSEGTRTYEVFGKRYTIMASSAGYQERGVASWYGKKFHGNPTANGETYDMYQMTAAHKALPLPTYVRVRNLRNNKTIVVRVNDRGPFVRNRIIDLSYAAALKLDMIRDGTSMVEVTALPDNASTGVRPTPQVSESPPPVKPPTSAPQSQPSIVGNQIFAQVGAFGESANAERRLRLLASVGISGGLIYKDYSVSPTLYRIRIGPIADVVQYDVLVEELENLGISDPYLITE